MTDEPGHGKYLEKCNGKYLDEPPDAVLEPSHGLDQLRLLVDPLPEHLELAHLQQVRQVQDLGYLNTSWNLFIDQ